MRIGWGRCAELLVAPWQSSGQLPRPRADTSPDMFLSGLVLCFCGLGLVRVTWAPPAGSRGPRCLSDAQVQLVLSLGCAGTTCTCVFPPRYNLYLFWGGLDSSPLPRRWKKVQVVPRPPAQVQLVLSLRWESTSCTFPALGKYKLYLPGCVLWGVRVSRNFLSAWSPALLLPIPALPAPTALPSPPQPPSPPPPEHPTRLGGERELGSGEGRRAGGEAGQRERGNERRGGRARGEVDSSETQNP